MTDEIRRTLEQVRSGELDVAEALVRLRPAADLGFAKVDVHRESRCGFPEVVFCSGKTPEQARAISLEILTRSDRVLLTRAERTHAEALVEAIPGAEYHPEARCIVVDPDPLPRQGLVAVVAAGTADLPVAEEAAITARTLGAEVATCWDVGVAGLHRLIDEVESLRAARVLVAVAGMEGALASVVGGLVDRPVIAVPTSVGYGMNLSGLAPMLAMLNSCAAGVGVVNVDNGFGAGYLAALINRIPDQQTAPPRS